MNNNDINSAWAAVAPILRKFKFYDIKDIVGLAGFDLEILKGLGFDASDWRNPNTSQLVSEIGGCFLSFADETKLRFLNTVIEEIFSDRYRVSSYGDDIEEPEGRKERLQYCLNRLGWQLTDNKILPIEILDSADLEDLDPSAREDLIKAATKFRDGDLSGAISSACGAVDSAIERVYRDKKLGEVDKSQCFQDRCKKALEATGVYTAIDGQLNDIDWKEGSVKMFESNLKGSLNQAALVMQLLRSRMSDAHGTKPVIKSLVFDSIKWSQIIVRLLSEKYDA